MASTNPRFVARQLSHLPQLLTSATVSSAFGLQNVRADPDLKKNTSAQVQNVLKFIISQNPLNVASAAKQQLGKMQLPSGGKPLVKSPSKSPAVGEAAASSTQSVSTPQSSPAGTASPLKTAVKEDSTPVTPPGKKESAQITKTTVTSSLSKVTVKSDLGNPGKAAGGVGKPSMLVGLLEGRKVGSGKDSSTTDTSTATASTCTSDGSTSAASKFTSTAGVSAVEQDKGKTVAGESESLQSPEALPTVKEAEKATEGAMVEKKEVEVMVDRELVEHEVTEKPSQQEAASATEPAMKEKAGVSGDSTELVCEEVMPETAQPRDTVTVGEGISSEAFSHPPPSASGDRSSEAGEWAVKTEESFLPPAPIQDPAPSSQAIEPVESRATQPSSIADRPQQSATTDPAAEEMEGVHGSRKRTCPTDLSLSPLPKKPHLTYISSPSPPPPPPPPTANLPLPVPTLTPLPTAHTTPTLHTSRVMPQTSTQKTATAAATTVPPSPGHSPSLVQVLVPPSDSSVAGGRRGDGKEEAVPVPHSVVAAPLKMFGGVTIQPLPSSLPHTIPPVCLTLYTVPGARKGSPLIFTQTVREVYTSSAVSTPPNSSAVLPAPPLPLPVPLSSLPSAHYSASTNTRTSTSVQMSKEDPLQLLPLSSPATTPVLATPAQTASATASISSTMADEALIQELCSEASKSTTDAALASQLGLSFLDQNLLGGIDLMQLVTSPFEDKPPPLGGCGVLSSAAPESPAETSETSLLPDTAQLLSEALTSLSTPCMPIISSPLPLLPPPLCSPSPSTASPLVQSPSIKQQDYRTSLTLTPLSSHFPAHTPTVLSPHTPSLSSPLTPEILPDINTLTSINEEELLEGIPPELAKTIQALAQLDQQSPLQ